MDIKERIAILYHDALQEMDKLHLPFIADNYRWEIGAHIIDMLDNKMYGFYSYREYKTVQPLLYGIEIEINVVNPDALILWRRIDG